MTEQVFLWALLLLLPWEIEATGPTEEEKAEAREGIRLELLKVENETRAQRQKRSGRGL